MEDKQKYISLKEAAEISGYAPDYVGQLIRKGKLLGKQVPCTIAWVTTEEAIRAYMTKDRRAEPRVRPVPEIQFVRFFRGILYLIIVSSVSFSLLLFYVFSVRLDQELEQQVTVKISLETR
jgi:hypothetical protein